MERVQEVNSNNQVDMTQKTKILLLTVGMICFSLVPMLISKVFFSNQIDYGPNTNDNIPRNVTTIFSLLFVMAGAINIVRFKEIPRPGLQSQTGFSAVIIGILLIALCLEASIEVISGLISLLRTYH